MTTPPPTLFHAILRPCVLQVLRATGYHSCRPAALEALTDLATRYLEALCDRTALHAALNDHDHLLHQVDARPGGAATLVDVRMALQDVGALNPDRAPREEEFWGEEDTRGVEDFVDWFAGAQSKHIMEMSRVDGEPDMGDYLNALKKKHSKTGEDSKYHGTILGKGNEVGAEVLVEGGELASIEEWNRKMRGSSPPPLQRPGSSGSAVDSRPPSSGLSSLGSRVDDDMDLS